MVKQRIGQDIVCPVCKSIIGQVFFDHKLIEIKDSCYSPVDPAGGMIKCYTCNEEYQVIIDLRE